MATLPPPHQRESTTELLVGLIADVRDLASAHLERMQREIRADLGNLGESIKTRALAVAGLVVAAVLAGQALALALSSVSGLPPWAGLGVVALVLVAASVVSLRRHRPAITSIDLIPERALAAAKDDLVLAASPKVSTADAAAGLARPRSPHVP
jgi:predicted signal transduction protein with EAL and GGDEF domain